MCEFVSEDHCDKYLIAEINEVLGCDVCRGNQPILDTWKA